MIPYTRLPESMRIFELAKRLEVPAAELLARVNDADIYAPSVLNSIDRTQMRVVLEDYRDRTDTGSHSPDPVLLSSLLASMNGAATSNGQNAWNSSAGSGDDRDLLANGPGEDQETTPTPVAEAQGEPAIPTPGEAAESVARPNERWLALDARRRILAVGIAIVLGTMLLTTFYALMRPTYAAESDVVITLSGLGSEEIDREMRSFAVVASSQTVLAPVADEFEMSVAELRDSFSSSIVGDSTVLRFTVTASDPGTALDINEAIVTSYLEVANQPNDQNELTFVETEIARVEDQMNTLDADLATIEAEEAAHAALRLQIESERTVAQAQLADLEGRLVDLRASGAAPAGSITFVEGQINLTDARLTDLIAEGQALESEDATTRSSANRLRDERVVIRSELQDLQSLKVGIELEQIAGTRVAVLASGHVVDDPVGLTPVRGLALGLLVGGALAFAWVVAATQIRRPR